jgi:hypothetical protein
VEEIAMALLGGLRRATRTGVPPGRQAAIKTGFPKAGLGAQARRQAGQVVTQVDLRPGFTAERIEQSPQRALLLKERFGVKLGGLLEADPDRFNLVRERLEREARSRPRRRVVAGKR